MKIFKGLKKQIGESLLEVTISLGLALLVVTALTVTTVNGLKNSQLSQNQLNATKYAQEGIERVRQIRERNCPVTVGSTQYYWYGPGNSIWSIQLAGFFKYTVNDTAVPAVCRLEEVLVPETIESGKFTRSINIVDGVDQNTKKVTVTVNWSDFSGTHESKLETSLTNN